MLRSSRDSILSEEEEATPEFTAAPLKEDVVNAAAVDARMEAIASFMLDGYRWISYCCIVLVRN